MSKIKFSEFAAFVVKSKNELYETTEKIIYNIFETSKDKTYDKGVYVLPFQDGALWMGNSAPCKGVIIKGLVYNKKIGKYFLEGIKDNANVNISINTLALEDLKSLICFMERNGYNMDELMELKEVDAKEATDKENNSEGKDSELKESDKNPDEKQDETQEKENEQGPDACYVGKPITPTEEIFG